MARSGPPWIRRFCCRSPSRPCSVISPSKTPVFGTPPPDVLIDSTRPSAVPIRSFCQMSALLVDARQYRHGRRPRPARGRRHMNSCGFEHLCLGSLRVLILNIRAKSVSPAAFFANDSLPPQRYDARPAVEPRHSSLLRHGGRYLSRHLPRGDVEPVPDVDGGDSDQQRRETGLVVMTRGLVPNLIRDWIVAIAEPRHGLGERERGAFGVGEVRRVPPGRDCKEPVVGFTGLLEHARVHVDAQTAAIDLAGAQLHQPERARRHAALLRGRVQRIHGLHRRGKDHDGMLHSWLHGGSPPKVIRRAMVWTARWSHRARSVRQWYDGPRRENVTDERA